MKLKLEALIVLVGSLILIVFGLVMVFITRELYWFSFVFLPLFWLSIAVIYLLMKKK